MATFRSYPRHLKPMKGKGYVQCQRSGFLRPADEVMRDVRGGIVARDFADITPGFGTRHPRDVFAPEVGGDPTPTHITTGVDLPLTKEQLGISDQEVEAAIRENRPPQPNLLEEN
jgi:hypothetical protein